MMWDTTRPVVSFDGAYVPLAYGSNQHGQFYTTTTQTATTADTEEAISWVTSELSNGVSINGGDATQIDFATAGTYAVNVTAHAYSGSAAVKELSLWIENEGVVVPGSVVVDELEYNAEHRGISMHSLVDIAESGYIHAMFAVDDLNLDLRSKTVGAGVTAPAVSIKITQVDV